MQGVSNILGVGVVVDQTWQDGLSLKINDFTPAFFPNSHDLAIFNRD